MGCVVLAAGMLSGVCRAAEWFPLGPYGGDARSLAADPANSKHLFLGTATGWIYDSHDGGRTWTRIAQIAHRNDLVVEHIVVDQHNPKRLIVAAYTVDQPGGGLFISEDYGKDWYSQAQMRGQSIRSLARSASNPDELVAGTLKGVFRSMDNGTHWKQISPEGGAEIKEVESIAIDPADPNVIYAGTWHLPWKTTDGGVTWNNIKQGIIDDSDVFSIIVDPKTPTTVYASACSGIYKSTDAGDLFKRVQGIPSTARRTRKLAQDPEHLDTVYAGTTEGLYRTLDGGTQWDRLTAADVIVNDVYVDPSNANHVLMATDRGGVFRSEDGGSTFEASNSGFSARQVTAYTADAKNGDTVYVGVVNDKATGGVFQSTDGGVHWQQQSDGLGGRDIFSLLSMPDGALLAGTGHGVFRLSGDGGAWADSSAIEGLPAAAARPEEALVRRPEAHPKLAVLHPAKRTVRVVKPVKPVGHAGHRAAGHALHPSLHRVDFVLEPVAVSSKRHVSATRRNSRTESAKSGVKSYGRVAAGHGSSAVHARTLQHSAPARPAAHSHEEPAVKSEKHDKNQKIEKAESSGRLDTTVYSLARSGDTVFAGSGSGLLRSGDGGQHWAPVSSLAMPEVNFLALLPPAESAGPVLAEAPAAAIAAPETSGATLILAAGLERLAFSPDGGATWHPVTLPADLKQIGAVGIDGDKNLWVGGREGVWFSTDSGASWKTLKNLFVTQVDNIFYDAQARRVLVTASTSPMAFSVQLPDHKVNYWDTGWKLRFVRPAGDHLVGGTLYDGVVVQPKMVDSPAVTASAALR